MLKICVPIIPKSLNDLLTKMKEAGEKADIIELWLGEIADEIDFDKIFAVKKEIRKPLLLNVKDAKEKGSFIGTDEKKLNILQEGAKRGAEYIDIDYEFNPDLLKTLKENKGESELIFSAHFFEGTPTLPSLLNRIDRMKASGADIVKIAALPNDKKDLLTILRLSENLSRSKQKFIAISMGAIGKSSRILTPFFGGEMMFAPLEDKNSSAPGQMTVEELKKGYVLLCE